MEKKIRLNEAIETFKLAQNMLSEDLGMGHDYEEDGYNPLDAEEEAEIAVGDDEAEEADAVNLAKVDDGIDKIRQISLCGLQKYAQEVDSEEYQFYKKIWLMCDKAVSEKDSVSTGSNPA